MSLEIGQPAPSFTTPIDLNSSLSLKDFTGKNLVLYFYPKDDTPGCTLESCGFRDFYLEIQALGGEVLGVSKDSISSHELFRHKYELPFFLGADTESEMCTAYDVIKEKSMYGKKYLGIERSTFLIDGSGILRYIWRGVSVSGHLQEVIAALKDLRK